MHGITKHIPLLILALYSCTAGAATIQTESKQAGIAGGLELDTYAASASASKAVPIYHSMQKLTGFSAANGVLTGASLSVSGSVWGGQGISGMVDSRIITPSQDANGRITRALDMRIGDRQYSLGSNSVDVRCVGANTYLCPYQDSFTEYGVRQSVAVEDLNLFVNDAGINFGRTGTVELFGTVTTAVLSVDYVGSRLSPGLTHVVGTMNGLFQVQANYEYLQHAAASFNADTDVPASPSTSAPSSVAPTRRRVSPSTTWRANALDSISTRSWARAT